ncbi:MAG: hypothetical protein ACLFVU_13440 [Phycisphaerae bacterium]
MDYRSMSFHEGWPDPRLVELGAKLGFNDLCFQTERGLYKPLAQLRQRADRSGYFEWAKRYGMTVSLWVHELMDYNPDWGEVAVDNDTLWSMLGDRYRKILTDQFPEVDYLVLVVVETQINVTESDLLVKLVQTLHSVCRECGKRLIFRSFIHHPDELADVAAAIERMSDDVIIMTKSVPQDWHTRSIDHPLIGKVGDKQQVIEVDIAGEYFRMDNVCHCFPDVLDRQFKTWQAAGCCGISVRVDRGWKPWKYQASVYGEAQEVNLWLLGRFAEGKADDFEKVWDEYARATFGKKAAPAMIEALKTTGNTIAEGLYVEREPFGESKYQYSHPLVKLPKDEHAVAYPDDEDSFRRNPFHMAWSPFRWDDELVGPYHRIRTGHPEVIDRKEHTYKIELDYAEESLDLIYSIRHELPAGAYPFFRFKLEENLFQLELYGEMQLAWLKMSCRLYNLDPHRSDDLLEEVHNHLRRVRKLQQRTGEGITCTWKGRTHHLHRAQYVDIDAFVAEFCRYWRIEEEPRRFDSTVRDE